MHLYHWQRSKQEPQNMVTGYFSSQKFTSMKLFFYKNLASSDPVHSVGLEVFKTNFQLHIKKNVILCVKSLSNILFLLILLIE